MGTRWGRVSSSSTSLTSGVGFGPGGTGTNPGTATGSGGTINEEGGDVPLWKFHGHTAAVKALAWDPHISGVLATGGGTQDKHIWFWNVGLGTMLNELDTGSQVSLFTSGLLYRKLNISTFVGLQSRLVAYVTRTHVDSWLLVHNGPEPDMYMEVSHIEHGCITHRTYKPCVVPGHESRW
jgi:WD40 repeat protein